MPPLHHPSSLRHDNGRVEHCIVLRMNRFYSKHAIPCASDRLRRTVRVQHRRQATCKALHEGGDSGALLLFSAHFCACYICTVPATETNAGGVVSADEREANTAQQPKFARLTSHVNCIAHSCSACVSRLRRRRKYRPDQHVLAVTAQITCLVIWVAPGQDVCLQRVARIKQLGSRPVQTWVVVQHRSCSAYDRSAHAGSSTSCREQADL
jgi:hypothetical protein